MISRTIVLSSLVALAAPVLASPAPEKAAAEPMPGVVVTSEGWIERCMLPLVITSLDGKAVASDTGRYEFESGSHTFEGYAQGDFAGCQTIADAGIGADKAVGTGSAKVEVPAGEQYFLGLDVRKADPATWKIVTWKIIH